jgi:hypothetical protein
MTMPITPLVPYLEANEETRAAYLGGLRTLRSLDANPAAWHCGVCGNDTPGDQVLISYGVGDTPITFCPTERCHIFIGSEFE